MEPPINWMSRRGFRVTFLGSLIGSILVVVCLSGWVLWPVWREYVDEQRADDLFRDLETMQIHVNSSPDAYLYSEEIKSRVERISSPVALGLLGQKCVEEDQPRWRNVHLWTIVCIFYRLADIKTDESARAFIGLYCDDRLALDGEYAECAFEALESCGSNALPHLLAQLNMVKESKKNWIQGRIEHLESLAH